MDYSEELDVFQTVGKRIINREYPRPLLQRILCLVNPWACKTAWYNQNQETFLVLIALEGPQKVLNAMKNTLTPIMTMSTLFAGITTSLALDPGTFSYSVTRDIFGSLMVASTMCSITAVIIAAFMSAQCELCDVAFGKREFLERLSEHEDMVIITSSTWSIWGIILSLPAMVVKVTDIYGNYMALYFGIIATILIKYTAVDLHNSVLTRRMGLQKARFDAILSDLTPTLATTV
jgi:hypothetical protein